MQQSAGKSRLLIVYAVPQSFEVANLLLSHFALEPFSQVGRRLHLSGQIVVRPPGSVLHAISLVGAKDLALALQEHGDQGVNARAEALDLTRIEVDGPGQFLLGEAAHASVHEQVLERRRDHVRRSTRRRREALGVIPLVGVNDPAEWIGIANVVLRFHRSDATVERLLAQPRADLRPAANRRMLNYVIS